MYVITSLSSRVAQERPAPAIISKRPGGPREVALIQLPALHRSKAILRDPKYKRSMRLSNCQPLIHRPTASCTVVVVRHLKSSSLKPTLHIEALVGL